MRIFLIAVCTLLLGAAIGAGGTYYFAPQPSAETTEATKPDPDPGTIKPLRAGVSTPKDENTFFYRNDSLGFSLEYPKDLVIKEYDEGGGTRTILFQKPDEEHGFQMFITPYSGAEITSDYIRSSIKSNRIEEPTEVVIGSGIRALIFKSEAQLIGESREVWFLHEGRLFQITTYAALDTWLAQILSTIKFDA